MDRVLEHLNLLYRKTQPTDASTGPEVYQEADRFLERFQKSIEAWTISVQLLITSPIPPEYRLFAAQSLRRKIVHDLPQLDFNELSSMKDTMLLLLKTSKESSKPLLTQLFLAVIYLAIQIDPVLWSDPIGDILNIYNDGFIDLNGLVIFLSLFPYECKHSQVVLEAGQEQNVRSIQSMYVLKILNFVFEIGNAQSWGRDLLECLFNWIKYGIRNEQECIKCLASLPLLDLAFSGLSLSSTSPECAPICCEIINEIIFKTSTIPTLSTSVPLQVFQGLRINFENAKRALHEGEEGEDFVIAWIDLCSEFCWSCEELMATKTDVFAFVMEMIIELSNADSIAIMERTFSYWEGIIGIFDRFPGILSEPEIMKNIEKFVVVLLKSMEIPQELENASRRSEQFEDWTNYCHSAREVLSVYAAEILPETRTIQLISEYATSSGSSKAVISAIEATRAVAKDLKESPLLLNTFYPLLSDKESIVAYVKLLAKTTHFDMIGRELDLIKCCLDDCQLFQEAILALKNIFNQSASLVSSQTLLEWIGILTEKSTHMPDFVQLEVCGCMASMLSKVPVEMSIPVYRSLVKDIVTKNSLEDPQNCIEAVEKIASVLKNATPSHHQYLSHVLMEQWPLFPHISGKFGDRINVMESIARALKYLVICNNALLVPVIEFSTVQFTLHCLSWPVYLLRFFLREFCTNPEQVSILTKSLIEISNHLFTMSGRIEEVSDVFIDFFKLLSLHTTITGNIEWRCFELGITCIAGSSEWTAYSDVINAVFGYLTCCLKSIRTSITNGQDCHVIIQRTISIFTDAVLFRVLHGVLIDYPSSLVYPVTELLITLVLLQPSIVGMMDCALKNVLQRVPHFTQREVEKQAEKFGQNIGQHDLDELEAFLFTLSRTSQRRLV